MNPSWSIFICQQLINFQLPLTLVIHRGHASLVDGSTSKDGVAVFAPLIPKAQTKSGASPTHELVLQRSMLVAEQFGSGTVKQARMLQWIISNQTTVPPFLQPARNLTGNVPHDHSEQAEARAREAPVASWDFSRIPIFAPDRTNQSQAQSPLTSPPAQDAIHRKLAVGRVSDPLEHEADRIAGQVMRMPNPALSIASASTQLSWKCDTCEEEEAKALQPKPAGPAKATAGEVPGIVHEVLSSPGQPLDQSTRAFFEPRFRHDFSHVRIHTDPKAARSARAINALAFTCGSDITFAHGRYEPNSASGRYLLAHELAHTVQQDSHSTVRRFIRSDAPAPLRNYLLGKGILGVTTADNAYSAGRRSTANAEQEVLVDMLASPREFNVDGADTQQAEKSLSAHVAARLGIVDFAAQKKYSFASVTGFKMNPQYYDIFLDKQTWKLKSGVDKQAAWQDLNLNPQLYAIGCAAATSLTQAGGSQGAKFRNQPSQDENDWVAGDAGYVTNKVFPAGEDVGLLGENIIYVGSGQFWGHFSGNLTYRTLTEWKAEVARWNGGGAPGASEVDSKRESPMTGLL